MTSLTSSALSVQDSEIRTNTRGSSVKSGNHPFPFSALPPETAWINGIVQSISENTSSGHFSSKMYPTKRFASHLPTSVCAPDVFELSLSDAVQAIQIAFVVLTELSH